MPPKKRSDEPAVRGFLAPCLLLLLSEKPQHGYSLMETLSSRKLIRSEVNVGNLYRALRRMEVEGLVISAWSGRKKRPSKRRRIYRITDSGTMMLRWWVESLKERNVLISRFLDEAHRILGSSTGKERLEDDQENR